MKNLYRKIAFVIVFVLIQIQLLAYIKDSRFIQDIIANKNIFQDEQLLLNFDNAIWGVNSNQFNVIANDKFIDSNGIEYPITLGANGNATIQKIGSWPSGFNLDENTGIISVDNSVNERPISGLNYRVCVGQLCKESSLLYQQINDVIQVTKTITSTASDIINGKDLEYEIRILNSNNSAKSVSFEEALAASTTNTILTKNQIEFVSWVFNNPSTHPSTLLSVDNITNKLKGDFIINANSEIVIKVKANLKAIIVPSINSITNVNTLDNSDNYLANNENVLLYIDVIQYNKDLAITSRIQDPNSTQPGNRITIRVTNVGKETIIAGVNSNNKIVVELDFDATSDNVYNMILGDFTYDGPSLSTTPGNRKFILNNNVNLAPGEYKEFSFTKDNFSNAGTNQERTHTFTLKYTPDQNSTNNTSILTHRNAPQPGKISFEQNSDVLSKYVCYNGSFKMYNRTSATSEITAANVDYKYQFSNDGGLTWQFIKGYSATNNNKTIIDVSIPKPDGDNSTDIVHDKDQYNTIEFINVTSDFLIRRYSFNAGQPNLYSWTEPIEVKVEQNTIQFANGVNSFSIVKGTPFYLPQVTTTYKSDLKYFRINPDSGDLTEITDTQSPISLTLPEGVESKTYEFLVQATTTNTGGNNNSNISSALGCETLEIFKVIVYDPTKCNIYTKRTFATHVKSWTSGLSGVANPEQAIPQDYNGEIHVNRANAATLIGGVVLLGIGTVGVDLYFTDESGNLLNLKNKKVVIKLGEQYSGLKVAGGLSVRAIKTDRTLNNLSVAPNLVGATKGVKGGVLDALKGDNVFEYSFIPATTSGTPEEFNGVRIQLGSLIGVADLASVFYAYIEEEDTITNNDDYCTLINSDIIVSPPSSLQYPDNQRDVDVSYVKSGSDKIENQNIKLNRSAEDAYWGNYSEVLNVASSLSSVVFPYYSIDDDYDSYTLFNATAGVLNMQFLRAKLRQAARPGDQVQITLAYPNINVLNLNLLQLRDFKIVYYNKGAKVGEELLEKFRVLDIGLFNFKDKRRAVLSRPVNFIYDEVELQQFNTVSVNLGDGIHIHDIRINPLLAFSTQQDPKDVTEICAAEPIIIEKPDFCTTYRLSLARVSKFGTENYKKEDGSDLLDYKGRKIYPIEEIVDLTPEELTSFGIDSTVFNSIDLDNELKAYFNLELSQLFTGELYDGKMLIKLQAVRKGCDYGEPQYLRVDFNNCNQGIINPVIMNSAKY